MSDSLFVNRGEGKDEALQRYSNTPAVYYQTQTNLCALKQQQIDVLTERGVDVLYLEATGQLPFNRLPLEHVTPPRGMKNNGRCSQVGGGGALRFVKEFRQLDVQHRLVDALKCQTAQRKVVHKGWSDGDDHKYTTDSRTSSIFTAMEFTLTVPRSETHRNSQRDFSVRNTKRQIRNMQIQRKCSTITKPFVTFCKKKKKTLFKSRKYTNTWFLPVVSVTMNVFWAQTTSEEPRTRGPAP